MTHNRVVIESTFFVFVVVEAIEVAVCPEFSVFWLAVPRTLFVHSFLIWFL